MHKLVHQLENELKVVGRHVYINKRTKINSGVLLHGFGSLRRQARLFGLTTDEVFLTQFSDFNEIFPRLYLPGQFSRVSEITTMVPQRLFRTAIALFGGINYCSRGTYRQSFMTLQQFWRDIPKILKARNVNPFLIYLINGRRQRLYCFRYKSFCRYWLSLRLSYIYQRISEAQVPFYYVARRFLYLFFACLKLYVASFRVQF
jgi:hypothetical protein